MPKKISDIVVGDKVKVYNTEDKTFSFSNVSKIWEHTSDHYYILNGKTKVTEMHPYYVEGEWIRVKDLKKGDKLLNKSGHTVPIKSLKRIEESLAVYNMEVEGEHNYFANDILVHNGKGGSYIGKDIYRSSDVGASRTNINDAAATFNATVPDTVGTALGSQFEAARAFKDAVGLTEPTMDGTQEGNTGFQKVLADTLVDNAQSLLTTQQDVRSNKTTELKSAGATFRETQKSVNKAKEFSGMVSSNERMQMDMDVTLFGATGEAQETAEKAAEKANETKSFEDAKAQTDFRDAVKQAAIDMENAMGDQVNSVVDTLNKQTRAMNETYKGSVGSLKGNQRANSADRVKSGSAKSRVDAYTPAITQSNYEQDTSSLKSAGAGTVAVSSSYNLKGTGGVQTVADTLSSKFKMGNFAGGGETTTAESFANPGAGDDADSAANMTVVDPMTSIQNVWSGASGDARLQQVMGPDNIDGVAGEDRYIVARCFAGDTIILTEDI